MTPDELNKLKQQMLDNMSAAMDCAFSDANPFFRAAERVREGMSMADSLSQELYSGQERVEARGWLEAGVQAKQKRFIHTYSPRKTSKLVEELYSAGAKIVWIVSPEIATAMQTSDVLIVALPEDEQHRLALARIHQREMAKVWCSEPDEEVPAPVGEHLLFQYT